MLQAFKVKATTALKVLLGKPRMREAVANGQLILAWGGAGRVAAPQAEPQPARGSADPAPQALSEVFLFCHVSHMLFKPWRPTVTELRKRKPNTFAVHISNVDLSPNINSFYEWLSKMDLSLQWSVAVLELSDDDVPYDWQCSELYTKPPDPTLRQRDFWLGVAEETARARRQPAELQPWVDIVGCDEACAVAQPQEQEEEQEEAEGQEEDVPELLLAAAGTEEEVAVGETSSSSSTTSSSDSSSSNSESSGEESDARLSYSKRNTNTSHKIGLNTCQPFLPQSLWHNLFGSLFLFHGTETWMTEHRHGSQPE